MRQSRDDVAHAKPHLTHRTRDGVVRVLAADHHRRLRPDAVRPDVRHHGRPRREQAGERRFGAAARERPTRRRPVADQIAHPAHDAVLQRRPGGRHLGNGERLVERRGERLRPDGRRQRRRHLMAGVARVVQSVAVGEDLVAQPRHHVVQRTSGLRRRLVEPRRQLGG